MGIKCQLPYLEYASPHISRPVDTLDASFEGVKELLLSFVQPMISALRTSIIGEKPYMILGILDSTSSGPPHVAILSSAEDVSFKVARIRVWVPNSPL